MNSFEQDVGFGEHILFDMGDHILGDSNENNVMEEPEQIEDFPQVTLIGPINDTYIRFPGNATPNQSRILESVLNAITNNKNSLIECPNDPERRQAIIVGILAALNRNPVAEQQNSEEDDDAEHTQPSRRKRVAISALSRRKIYFATKSFLESNLIIKELKKLRNTGYLQDVKLAVLGPRDNEEPCICKKNGRPRCVQPPQDQDIFKFIEDDGAVHTLEELLTVAKRKGFCPDLYNKQILSSANFIICPQQLITSPLLRFINGIQMDENTIKIFDDGENIEKICYDESSLAVSCDMLNRAGMNLAKVMNSCRGLSMSPVALEAVRRVRDLSTSLLQFSTRFQDEKPSREEAIADLLRTTGFQTREDADTYLQHFQIYLRLANNDFQEIEKLHSKTILNTYKFLIAIKYYLGSGGDHNFTLQLSSLRHKPTVTVFNVICVNPSVGFRQICNSASSVIIGSRCLPSVPILREQLGQELIRDADTVVVHEHEGVNCFFGYCGLSPNEVPFVFSHDNKQRGTVHEEVGEAVLQFCELVPKGIVLLFPSRDAIRQRVEVWEGKENRETSIMEELKRRKHVFNELKFERIEDARREIEKFRKRCAQPLQNRTGAIMLALHRGNVNSIMDFQKVEIRLIVNVGIPFDSWYAPSIKAKRHLYFQAPDSNCTDQESVQRSIRNGLWYNAEAFHILSRTFSHGARDDWIAVITLDKRMSGKEPFDFLIPSWIKTMLLKQKYLDFETMATALQNFVEGQNQ